MASSLDVADRLLRDPLTVLNEKYLADFYQNGENIGEGVVRLQQWAGDTLRNNGLYERVPILTNETLHTLPPFSLVRVRGMVQDEESNPSFATICKTQNTTTIFREEHPNSPLAGESNGGGQGGFIMRARYHLMPLPNSAPWWGRGVGEGKGGNSNDMDIDTAPPAVSYPHCVVSKYIGEAEEEGGTAALNSVQEVLALLQPSSNTNPSTKIRVAQSDSSCPHSREEEEEEAMLRVEALAEGNSPPAPPRRVRQRTAEDEPECEEDPQPCDQDVFDPASWGSEFDIPKGARCLRLHALYRNPDFSIHSPNPATAMGSEEVRGTKGELLSWMKGCLGDDLTAEYLLLSLLSHVKSREPGFKRGVLPLHFVLPQEGNQGAVIRGIISRLAPVHLPISLSEESLYRGRWVPHKDHTADCLRTGMLQLPHGSVVTVDESLLREAQLKDTAVLNVNALKEVLETQELSYDFTYHSIPMPSDFVMVHYSQGKSLFSQHLTTIRFPASSVGRNEGSPVAERTQEAEELLSAPSESDLHRWREYLAQARMGDSKPKSGEEISADMAQLRSKHPVLFEERETEAVFHSLLNIASLFASSKGEGEAGLDDWEEAKRLEKTRMARERGGHTRPQPKQDPVPSTQGARQHSRSNQDEDSPLASGITA